MKKFITLAALLLTLVSTYSFAADTTNKTNGVNGEITAAFRKDFQDAQIISAENHRNFTKLTFKMNEIVLFAFYNENGQLLAVTRNILATQLPIGLQMNLKKGYEGYWITECIEYSGEGQNTYYISLENADQKTTLRSNSDHSWEVYQKTDKK